MSLAPPPVLRETQETIVSWAEETFPSDTRTLASIAARANVEMAELLEAIAHGAPPDKIALEAADVLVILFQVAAATGHDLQACVDVKMSINRSRQWHRRADGRVQHKET